MTAVRSRPEGTALALLSAFFAFFYVAIAVDGAPRDIAQASLAVAFIPALFFWRDNPIRVSVALLILLGLWTVNWYMALPDNLGLGTFTPVVVLVTYSAGRFARRQGIGILLLGTCLAYCVASPIMWEQGESGMQYRPREQALSWLLFQWLALFVIYQIARRQLADELQRREREEQRHQIEEEQRAVARTHERELIAREIHDILAYSLTLINVQASAGKTLAAPDSDEFEILDNIHGISRSALHEVRVIVRSLHDADDAVTSASTDATPLSSASMNDVTDIDHRLDSFRVSGMNIQTTLPDDHQLSALAESLPRITQLALLRIVSESLTNVVRHQGPHSRVELMMRLDSEREEIILRIASAPRVGDEPTANAKVGAGSGQAGMSKRIEIVGGRIDFQGDRDGYVVTATVPTSLKS